MNKLTITPNGKKLGDCTKEDLLELAQWHETLGVVTDLGPPDGDASADTQARFAEWRRRKDAVGGETAH
jgi:hypothetical protein